MKFFIFAQKIGSKNNKKTTKCHEKCIIHLTKSEICVRLTQYHQSINILNNHIL